MMNIKIIVLVLVGCVLETIAKKQSNNTIVGANLGGWMVLEPWITPSLFY